MPEYATSAKLKALRTDIHENTPRSGTLRNLVLTTIGCITPDTVPMTSAAAEITEAG